MTIIYNYAIGKISENYAILAKYQELYMIACYLT